RFGDEFENLFFALADQPQGDGLDPAGAGSAANAAPEQGADLVADQTVDHPPRLLGVDFVQVEFGGMGEGLLDGGSGDLVVGDPGEPAVVLEDGGEQFSEVPGD